MSGAVRRQILRILGSFWSEMICRQLVARNGHGAEEHRPPQPQLGRAVGTAAEQPARWDTKSVRTNMSDSKNCSWYVPAAPADQPAAGWATKGLRTNSEVRCQSERGLVAQGVEEMRGDFEDLIIALMERPENTTQISCAVRSRPGRGTNKRILLIEMMTTRSNNQINDIKLAYCKMYGTELKMDIEKNASGSGGCSPMWRIRRHGRHLQGVQEMYSKSLGAAIADDRLENVH
uniref:Annexin n=1 Tax=Globodera rostochiensis TaxID=31243 RepID=A0A914GQL1_GLORO